MGLLVTGTIALVTLTIVSKRPTAVVDVMKQRMSDRVLQTNRAVRWTKGSRANQQRTGRQERPPGLVAQEDARARQASGQSKESAPKKAFLAQDVKRVRTPGAAEQHGRARGNSNDSRDVFADKLPEENPQPEIRLPDALQPEYHQPEYHQPEYYQPEHHGPDHYQPELYVPGVGMVVRRVETGGGDSKDRDGRPGGWGGRFPHSPPHPPGGPHRDGDVYGQRGRFGDRDEDGPSNPAGGGHHLSGAFRVDRGRAGAHRRAENRRKEAAAFRELVALLGTEQWGQPRPETANDIGESRHVFFLKVHKAASTTVMSVLFRFALRRHLNVMLPRTSNVISEGSKRWVRNVMPLPAGVSHFDILCNHLVFDEQSVRSALPADALFVGIVREPFQQFVSAFLYYRTTFRIRYLARIPGPDPIAAYLRNPAMFESRLSQSSYTHNRMSFDFGMEPGRMVEESYIADYVTYLNRTFHLVMVSERFDESMVLLKRLLGWRLQDVLYVKNNVFQQSRHDQYTEAEKQAHRSFNAADYALYEHFSRLFDSKVRAEGRLFPAEVAAYVSLRERVGQFCEGPGLEEGLRVGATAWTAPFHVSKEDCLLMTVPEVPFVSLLRGRQYGSRFLRGQRVRPGGQGGWRGRVPVRLYPPPETHPGQK